MTSKLNPVMTRETWNALTMEDRLKLSEAFSVTRSGHIHVADNQVVEDGFQSSDLAQINVESMREFTKRDLTGFQELLVATLDILDAQGGLRLEELPVTDLEDKDVTDNTQDVTDSNIVVSTVPEETPVGTTSENGDITLPTTTTEGGSDPITVETLTPEEVTIAEDEISKATKPKRSNATTKKTGTD